ncbi:carbohydrate kinase [Allostella vacuolata]|nr:carbohydrate kinase [Stella vacuolata]
MTDAILCLDSGTTAVKAAIFTACGRIVAMEEAPNDALRRSGAAVEQDMDASLSGAVDILGTIAGQLGRLTPRVLVVTGQGDGTWPIDSAGRPVDHALTWLDSRPNELIDELEADGSLARLRALTLTRPTAASQPLQLAWLARRQPDRFARIARSLRSKEWLVHGLTGEMMSEPSAVMPNWGDWRRQAVDPEVGRILGLPGLERLLPPVRAFADCHAGLSPEMARRVGLPAGLTVLLGPGDSQAAAIGLGVGVLPGMERISLFGTSAIHMRHLSSLDEVRPEPPGAILLPFAEPGEYLRSLPGLNGATILSRMNDIMRFPGAAPFQPNGLVVHPFLEAAGERAPVTDPHAAGALLGLSMATEAGDIASAGFEALAFVARMSHEMMGGPGGPVALSGGLSGDDGFARLFATVLQRPVRRTRTAHSGLVGVGLLGARHIAGGRLSDQAGRWLADGLEEVPPETGPLAAYLDRKYRLFCSLLERIAPLWPEMAAVGAMAETLRAARR